MTDFTTAAGVSYEGMDLDGNEMFRVEIPQDGDGHIGRQCPSCRQMFRIEADDFKSLPEDTRLFCVYCGHRDETSAFLTDQQRARVEQVAIDAARELIENTLGTAFRDLARSNRSNDFVKVSYRSTPFFPQPLPGIDEETLVRERRCPTCNLRYAVFGDHRFCPVSGPHTPLVVAQDALAAETAKLDLLSTMPDETKASLREQGVIDRIYADVLSNVVGTVETLAKDTFNARVPDPETHTRGKGNIFQRLDRTADLYDNQMSIDLRTAPGVEWSELLRLWAVRHVYIHNGGLVDDRYLKALPTSPLRLGQRVLVPVSDARKAIAQALALVDVLAPPSS